MKLHDLLKDTYTAWRADLPASWQAPLAGVEPDFAGVPTTTTIGASIRLFPRLKTNSIACAPPGASALRCLDRVPFSGVRVVVVGQDPYPRCRQATGRGFEQGSWVAWDATSDHDKVPASFRRVIQRVAQFRTGNNGYVTAGGWSSLTAAVAAGTLMLDPPGALYDSWENQGAIFLNKVLTYTLPAHVFVHHDVFWRPVVRRIVEQLAARSAARVVFAMWGAEPAKLQSAIKSAATAAGAWNTRVKVVTASHPATGSFLNGINQFRRINDELTSIGGASVSW